MRLARRVSSLRSVGVGLGPVGASTHKNSRLYDLGVELELRSDRVNADLVIVVNSPTCQDRRPTNVRFPQQAQGTVHDKPADVFPPVNQPKFSALVTAPLKE